MSLGVGGPANLNRDKLKPPRIRGLLSILAERAAAECVRAGGIDLTSGIRPHGRKQGTGSV